MKLAVHDNRGNGQPLFSALSAAGHDVVRDGGDVFFSDSDADLEPYRTLCDAHERGLLHPHGAGFIGPWPQHPHTRGQFVTGEGHADVLKALDYRGQVEVLGWHFCEQRDFRPISVENNALRVLLAPTHAMADGWIDPWLPKINMKLHAWLATMPIRLTVRYVHGWEPLGIAPFVNVATDYSHVTYEQGTGMLDDAVAALEGIDVVIGGTWTFPTLAVARGIPTIMYGSGPMDWRYSGIVRFPLTADDCLGRFHLWELIKRACEGSAAVTEWRKRWIGQPWEPTSFVKAFEKAAVEW